MRKFGENQLGLLFSKVLKNSVFQNLGLLLFFCATAMLISVVNKFDFRWDFTNYHYYNPFAFFNDRLNFDIVPASVNTFFNPLIDVPLYLLVKYFNGNLDLIFAVQGIWFGLLLFVFYKIVLLFFNKSKISDLLKVLLVVCVAATSQIVWFQIGSSTNEIQMALCAMLSLYILFDVIKNQEKQRLYKFFISGLVLGCALGLKPTIVYVCVSSGVTLILCYKFLDKPIKSIMLFAVGGLLGYLLINGWWMYKMWDLYQNPFFPFLNGFFKSPYFDDFNYSDKRFIPRGLDKLIFPYTWNGQGAENYFFDLRGVIFYTIALFFVGYMSLRPSRWKDFVKNRLWCFYAVFLFLSYVIWMSIFSVLRYFIVVEMLSAIFLIKILFLYKSENNIKFSLYYTIVFIVLGVLLLIPRDSYDWDNLRNEKKFIDIERVKLPENSLLKLYNFPTAAIIVEFAKENNFRGLGYKHINATYMKGSDFVERGKFRNIRDEIEKKHIGETVVVYRKMNSMLPWYQDYMISVNKELDGKYCRRLENNLDKGLCICVSKDKKNEILISGNNEKEDCEDDMVKNENAMLNLRSKLLKREINK